MADYKINLGVKIDTKDINSQISNYKAKPIDVKVKLDTSDIQKKLANYNAKPMKINAELNTKGIAATIRNYTTKALIKVDTKLNMSNIDAAIKNYTAKSIEVGTKLRTKDISEQLRNYKTTDTIEVDAKLNDKAIDTAIQSYKPKQRIKVALALNAADIEREISGYEARSPLRVKVKINKTDINSQLKQYDEADQYITVKAKLDNGAVTQAIRDYKANTPIKVSLELDYGDIDKKLSAYRSKSPAELPVNMKLNVNDIRSQLMKYRLTVPVELLVANLDIADIEKKLSAYKTSTPIKVGVKLDQKDINAQIKTLQKPTEPINVDVKLNESNINADIALFKPTATLGIQPDLIIENVEEQISSYIPKAKIKVNVDLNDINIDEKTGKQNAQAPIMVNVKVDRNSINEEINSFTPTSKLNVGVQLDRDDIAQQLRTIVAAEPVRIGVELDPEAVATVQNQIQDFRPQANIGGAGGNGNGNGRGGRRQVDETTQAYRELMGVLNELNSKRLQLNGLDASSPQSAEKIQRLRLQIEQLDNEYNNLLRSFNAQGIQFSPEQWNQLETAMARVGRQIDVVQAGMSDKSAIKSQTQAYRELLSISKEIGSLEINIARLKGQGGNSNQIEVLENQLKTLQSTYQQLATTMDTPLTNEQWSAIYTQIAKTSEELEKLRAKYADIEAKTAKGIRGNFGNYDTEVQLLAEDFGKLSNKLPDVQAGIDRVKQALADMKNASNDNDLIEAEQRYQDELKETEALLKKNRSLERQDNYSDNFAAAKENAMQRLNGLFEDGSQAAKRFGRDAQQLRNELNNVGNVKGVEIVNKKIKNLGTEVKNSGLQVKTFGSRLKDQFSKYTQYLSIASVFMYASQAARSMFEQVKLIDSAMTELKKVTNENDASYNEFLSNAASKAKEIGTTIDGLVSSTADFARLGYDFEDAQGLAEVANIYAVVGDEIEGVEDATQSLVSTLAAFKDEMGNMDDSDFALSIVDKMNEVANNYSISSGGLGQALQRSASSMAAANNTLDETIAMITAANEVAQNPEKVGNAMKTISMRIRGAKTELEEAGESTDGMADSTAKLRQEILALSGVDIMLNDNTFKSTYQIMDELSQKWENLTDIQQASITELMAGKHQGNVMSSLMSNFETARKALDTSLNSSGSAMAEHAKWSESLEARLLKLKATWQSLAQSFMTSDFLKVGLDAITGFVDIVEKLIDTLGTIPTLLIAFSGFKIIKTVFSNGGLGSLVDILGLLKNAFPSITSGAKKLVTSLREISLASGGAGTALHGFLSLIMMHPYITAAVVAVTALTAAFTYQKKKAEDLAKKVSELTKNYKQEYNELKKLKNDYDTSNEDSMVSKYERLSKGVDNLGRNVSLTSDEYSEYQSIVNTIASQIPSLVSGYDEQGNALLSCKGNVEQLTAAYENLIHVQNNDVLANAGNIEDVFSNTLEEANSGSWDMLWQRFFWGGKTGGEMNLPAIKLLEDVYSGKLSGVEEIKNSLEGLTIFEEDVRHRVKIAEALEESGVELIDDSVSKTLDNLMKTDPSKLKGIIDNYYAQFGEVIEQQKSIATAKLSEAFDVSNVISGLDYGNISEELQAIAYQTVNGFDFDFFSGLSERGETVEGWVTDLLNQLNSISKEDNAKIETGFELQTKFNGGEISYGEYVNSLKDVKSTIDGLNLKDEAKKQIELALGLDDSGVVEQYNILLKRLTDFKNYDFDIDESEARSFLDSLSSEELAIAIDVIAEMSNNNVVETIDEIQDAVEKEIAIRGLNIKLDIELETAKLESLSTALSESLSGSGLSSESVSAIEGMFSDLGGYDPSKLFERTANGIRLNSDEIRRLNSEYKNTKISDINKEMDSLGDIYNQTKEELYSLTYGTDEYNSKAAELDGIRDRINSLEQLAAQYRGLSSSYQEWQMAESAGSQRDMYENVIKGLEGMDDEISRGWYDDGTIEFLELLTGKDLSTAGIDEVKKAYNSLGKEIEHTSYSVRDFFTTDEDGNTTSAGVYNFLDAIGQLEEEAFGGKDVVKREGNKIIGFDFQIAGGDKAIAEALGISEELVQIMVRAADDAGFVVSMDGTYQQLDVLKKKAAEAALELKNTFKKTNYDFFQDGSEEGIVKDYQEALKIWETFSKNKNADGTVNMSVEGAEEAYTLVSTLQSMVDQLSEPVYMELNASQVEKDMQTPLSKLQEYERLVQTEHQLQLKGADTTEIDKAQNEIIDYFEGLSPEIKAQLGIKDLSREEIQAKVEAGEIKVPATIDLQVEMNETLRDMVNVALYNAGLIDKKELETRVDIVAYADEVDTSDVQDKTESAVKEAVEGKDDNALAVETNVELQATIDEALELIQKFEDKDITISVTVEGLEDVKELNRNIDLATNIDGDIDSLSRYVESAKALNELDDNIASYVTAEIRGNVINTSAYQLSNLQTFVDSAQGLEGINTKSVTITANVDGNVFEENESTINNLGTFVESASGLEGVNSKAVSITANVNGSVFDRNESSINNLETFISSASGIEGVNSKGVYITADINGSVFTTEEYKINNLQTFISSASGLEGINSKSVTITADVLGNVFTTEEYKINNLQTFISSASGLEGINSKSVTITADVLGNVFTTEEYKINNLQTFISSVSGLEGISSKSVTITANVLGNVFTEYESTINNLQTFISSASGLDGIDSTSVTITANVLGNVFDRNEYEINNLETFVNSANGLEGVNSKAVSISANVLGNVFDRNEYEINNLETFVNSAKGLEGIDSKSVTITANVDGNVFTTEEYKINNLQTFVNSANGLEGVNSKSVTITANVLGNVFDKSEKEIGKIKTFTESINGLKDSAISSSVTANVSGTVLTTEEYKINNLKTFVDSTKDIKDGTIVRNVTAGVAGNVLTTTEGNLEKFKTFTDSTKDVKNEIISSGVTANVDGNIIGDSENRLSKITEFKSIVSGMTSQTVSVSVTANVDSANIENAITVLTNVANSGVFKDYNATVKVGATVATIDDTKVQNYNVPPKDGIVTYDVESSLVDAWPPPPKIGQITYNPIVSALTDSQLNKTGTITYKANIIGLGPAAGTAHAGGSASGRAFARGDWGIKGNGVALGGELGRELVVRDGKFFTIGDDGAEFFRYKKNDIVFNAAQTESLFKYGGIKGANPRGKMLASGTAFADGSAFNGGSIGSGEIEKPSNEPKDKGNNPKQSPSDSKNEAKETIDWIEIAIDRIERAIDKLNTKANSIYRSWSERNKNLAGEISKVGEEINLQQKAYDRYIQETESVGLDADYAEKVRNGTIDIEKLNDEELIDKIGQYKEWYEKAIDCKDAILELKETESELYAQRFENVQTQYDGILQGYEHTETMLNEYISQAEEKGYIVSKKYYQALVDNEKSNIAELKKEQAELIAERDNAVAEGKITKGSEAWFEQCAAIDDVTQAIEKGSTALLEYARAMEEIDWSIFDLIQERISDVSKEAEFLIELMSNEKLFDDDGKLTSQGLATMALHAQNYNTNMYAADTYGEEVAKLDAQIEKDPYDQELINRRNELLELQRESILAAEDEKNAIRDMVEEGIELELSALDEKIKKYEEALDSQKDLYDYQRKVEDSSKNISSLQKQLSSYEGFDDEETKAKVQQLKVELEEAEADLKETEYDKYLSDQTALLDTLYNEYELILNQRLDNVDYLLEQVIESINVAAGADSTIASALGSEGAIAIAVSNNATSIKDTLTSEAKNVGTTLSSAMNNIWSVGEGNAKSVLTMYGEDFRTKSTTVITTLNGIKSSVNSMVSSLNKEAAAKTNANKTSTSAKKNPTTTFSSAKKTTNKKSSGDGKPKIGDRVKYISGQYYYDSQGKKPLGSHKKGEYVYITNINTRDWATHGYHISTGKKLGSGDLGWLKLNQLSGYSSGKNNFLNDEVAWTQEDWEKKGKEFIVRPSDGAILTPIAKGDSVLTSAASNNIWDMANSPAEFIRDNLNLGATGVPDNSAVQSSYTQHFDKVVFNFPNVKNYEEMLMQMQKDRSFEKLITSMTIDRVAGGSSLAKGKSIR